MTLVRDRSFAEGLAFVGLLICVFAMGYIVGREAKCGPQVIFFDAPPDHPR